MTKVRDPVYKNNSHGMKGVFSGGYHESFGMHLLTNLIMIIIDEVNIGAIGGNISTREDNLRKILEGTEKYEKLAYFTPEKQFSSKVL